MVDGSTGSTGSTSSPQAGSPQAGSPLQGIYLYCVAEGSRDDDLDLKGIGGGEVFSINSRGLAAVVQECEQDFSAEDAKLASEWLLAHQAVVDLAWERFETIVPFSFGTVIIAKDGRSARENLIEWLAKEEPGLRDKLLRLKGKAEYGVQISWNPTVLGERLTQKDEEVQKLEDEIRSKPPGAAYLLKQKLEGLLRQRLETAADVYFKEFYQKIRGRVEEICVDKVRKEEPPRQMLANLSCLLAKERVSELGEELDRIARIDGFFVRFTGPWPPYSFVKS